MRIDERMVKNILYFFVNNFFIVALWKIIGFAGYLYYNVSSFNCIV